MWLPTSRFIESLWCCAIIMGHSWWNECSFSGSDLIRLYVDCGTIIILYSCKSYDIIVGPSVFCSATILQQQITPTRLLNRTIRMFSDTVKKSTRGIRRHLYHIIRPHEYYAIYRIDKPSYYYCSYNISHVRIWV